MKRLQLLQIVAFLVLLGIQVFHVVYDITTDQQNERCQVRCALLSTEHTGWYEGSTGHCACVAARFTR